MKAMFRASTPLLAVMLAACGTDPAPEPTEQIVVREPGAESVADASDSSAADDAAEASTTGTTATETTAIETTAIETTDSLVTAGKAAFNACIACHTIEQGGANRIGPNLHDIVGKAAGGVDGFTYSDALASSDIVWTKAELDSFIADPAARVPGTTMMAGAVSDAGRRQALIAYIEDASAN